MQIDCAMTPPDVESALQTTIDLHRKRWGVHGVSDAFQPEVIPFHREFARLAAELGWLRLSVLRLDGTSVAALYGFRYGSTYYFYQSGFDPDYAKHSVGVALMGWTIKAAIEEGAVEYDFLHGDEEYKFHWASGVRSLNRLELHPPGTGALIFRHAIGFNRAARQMARRVLNRAHATFDR
jgi:CelD/BcsL family acetyltransferase involved in cellulose biosynthesis